MNVPVEKITHENFKPYGEFVDFIPSAKPTVENDMITFWKQQAGFLIDGNTEIGVLKVRKQEMIFNEFENHFKTPTILIGLDGSFVIPVSTPSDDLPKSEDIVAFEVPEKTALVLADKCWHGTTFPIDKDEITLLVIFKENALDDDSVFEKLDETCEIVF